MAMKKFFEGIGWRLTVILSCVCFSVGHVKAANTVYGYEYVDLGLPSGLLWATCNVGASSPEEYGDYFAWGGVCWSWGGAGEVDSPEDAADASSYSVLPPELDAATTSMNKSWYPTLNGRYVESWRMPTYEEMLELKNNTTISTETLNGVSGRRLTSKKNSNSIFIPFCGNYVDGEPKNIGVYANLWTSSSYNSTQGHACWFKSTSTLTFGGVNPADMMCIRPVCPKIVKATGIKLTATSEIQTHPEWGCYRSCRHWDYPEENEHMCLLSVELIPENATEQAVRIDGAPGYIVDESSWLAYDYPNKYLLGLSAYTFLDGDLRDYSGTYTVTARTVDGSNLSASCVITVIPDNIHTGKCGDNLYYEIVENDAYSDGQYCGGGPDIRIWGTGDMYDYDQMYSPFNYEFWGGNCGSLTISEGVTSIGNKAFENQEYLFDISLPSTIRRIGSKAFSGCVNLASIVGLEKVGTIADDAFWNCMELNIPLEGIELTETRLELKVGESHSFELAKIYPNYFPQSDYFSVSGILSWTTSNESVLHADDFACEALSQGSANILVNGKKVCTVEVFNPAYDFEVDGIYYKIISNSPACVGVTRELGEDSPRPCYSGIVDIPSTVEYNGVSYQVTKILAQAFNFDEQLKEVNIPSTITNIEQLAFFDTGITEISIVNPNAKLEDRCFWNCPKLEKVTLADGVVLDCVFEECDKLNTLYLGAVPPVTTDAGIDVITKVTLYVPSGCTDVYKAHAYWRRFPNIIEYNVESDTDISQYSNIIFALEQEMWGGEEDYITLYMNNTIEVNAFSFNMQLPEGFEYVLNAKGRPVVEWTGDREDDHVLTLNLLEDGSLNVAGISLGGYTISGNEGALLRVKVKVPEDVDDELNLVLRNIELADLASNPYKVERCVSTLIVKPYVLGDVNNDHLVTIADASGVVGMVVGTAPATLNRKAADVNKDNTVSIADASGIVAIVINYQPSAKAPLRDAKPIDFSLTAGTMSMAEDGTAELPICLNNAEQSTALQFDLALPAGMTLVGITPSEDHVAQFSRQSDGTYRIAILSLQNELFADATVMTLTLQGNGNANGRVIKASAIEVVDSNLNPCHPCDAFFSIDATGIETVGTDMDTMTYDLFGRRNDTKSNGIRIMGDQKVLNK